MEFIIESIVTYGLETIGLALVINLFTSIIKLPIKLLAKKSKNRKNITRFIVFMPIVLGFVVVYLYYLFLFGNVTYNREFITLWITATSFSLTFYAIFEKVFVFQSEEDVNENVLSLLMEISNKINNKKEQKIVLSGNKEKEV